MQIIVFLYIIVSFLIGYFIKDIEVIQKNKKTQPQKNNEQEEKYKRTKEAFDELMNYDYSKALGNGSDRNE